LNLDSTKLGVEQIAWYNVPKSERLPTIEDAARTLGGILLMLSVSLLSSSCEMMQNKQTYAIGDTGPAGGIVFFDKGEYNRHSVEYLGSNDNYSINTNSNVGFSWRYMEVAPSGWYNGGEDPMMTYGGFGILVGGPYGQETSMEIGTGKSNTQRIISLISATEESEYAAKVCSEYSVTVGRRVYDDWFLPAWYTQQAIWWNIISDQSGSNSGKGKPKSDAMGDFSPIDYWSSSESGGAVSHTRSLNAQHQNFSDGYRTPFSLKNISYGVRPVRAF